MFNFFSKSKTSKESPTATIKHYAVKLDNTHKWYNGDFWSKVSSTTRPNYNLYPTDVIGPFPSEKDAEEYCDRNNLFLANRTVKFYNPQPINTNESKK